MGNKTTFVFDLDGTLVDGVSQRVLAWQEALEAGGIELSVWRIHRRIGMKRRSVVGALLHETGSRSTSPWSPGSSEPMPRPMGAASAGCGYCPAPTSCGST